MSHDDRLIYRCPRCGMWRMPDEHMTAPHECKRCPRRGGGGRRCIRVHHHVGKHQNGERSWGT